MVRPGREGAVVRSSARPGRPPGSASQSALLAELEKLDKLIAGHRATLAMLERERLALQHRLRLAGYRAPIPQRTGNG